MTTFTIPVCCKESVYFAASSNVKSAVLSVGGIPLSAIAHVEGVDGETFTDLPFFGTEPLHCALITAPILVKLCVEDGVVPTLMTKLADHTDEWDDAVSWTKRVTTHTESGEVEKDIVYLPDRVGFQRSGASAEMSRR